MKTKPGAGIVAVILLMALTACGQSRSKNNESMKATMNDSLKFEVNKTDEEWKKSLTESQYYILREKGTERPFSGKLLMNKEKGNYTCAACGNILFSSDAKFDSHCGWPSFDKEIAAGH